MTTTREAIELAREAGFITLGEDFVIRLIDLAKQQENEACAKVCDESVTSYQVIKRMLLSRNLPGKTAQFSIFRRSPCDCLALCSKRF